ncbi:MAG: bifunctional phosphopantothenoylcysteine decarboxylase/phosphopantothenate--cysteine ligase CoaBC [Gemmatimonadetes bacterium]|nr:bifunctional phosphopantothenoylcysteine decarboxylase/phosphopantothenate--cysteine ligase CoaBC [Gemmatimonadota bacterium]
MILAGRRVVLGVSGGIACYKSCTIARRLTEAGAAVDVILTHSAAEFVRGPTFEALTGRPVLQSLWEPGRALDHIHLARDAELVAVAPATANLLARAAQGLADDFLTTVLLARTGPVLIAPAMNDRMFAHDATQRNLDMLRHRGWQVVGPAIGDLAEGPSELPGRMVEPEEIVVHIERALRGPTSRLRGKKIVISAGPTREPLDPVRVLTNRSTGRMGYALAEAAFARGADVLLVSGPTSLRPPAGITVIPVSSTEDLCNIIAQHIPSADALIMAAAPSDFRIDQPAGGKRPRINGSLTLTLEPTVDVLGATLSRRPAKIVCVGFALETGGDVTRAREKLRAKRLDLIVLNDAMEPGAGFEVDTNRVTLVTATDAVPLPLMSKRAVAEQILDRIEPLT